MAKRHEECVLFLEDFFAESHAEKLRAAGYARVERFVYHFKDQRTHRCEQSVKDPPIIRLCHKEKWLLVTHDKDMIFTHVETIKKTDVAILATAHNNADTVEEWVDALIIGKAAVERFFKKCPRPSFATFNRQGKISSQKTITPDRTTRRKRPKEAQEMAHKSV